MPMSGTDRSACTIRLSRPAHAMYVFCTATQTDHSSNDQIEVDLDIPNYVLYLYSRVTAVAHATARMALEDTTSPESPRGVSRQVATVCRATHLSTPVPATTSTGSPRTRKHFKGVVGHLDDYLNRFSFLNMDC